MRLEKKSNKQEHAKKSLILAEIIADRAVEYTSSFHQAAAFDSYVVIWINKTYPDCCIKIKGNDILKSNEPEDIYLKHYAQKHCKWLKSVFDDFEKKIKKLIIHQLQKELRQEIESLNVLSVKKRTMKDMTDFIACSKILKSEGKDDCPTSEEIFHYSPTGELNRIWDWYAEAKRKERRDKRRKQFFGILEGL